MALQVHDVPLSYENQATAHSTLSIRIGHVVLTISPGFDAALLADVVRTLSALC